MRQPHNSNHSLNPLPFSVRKAIQSILKSISFCAMNISGEFFDYSRSIMVLYRGQLKSNQQIECSISNSLFDSPNDMRSWRIQFVATLYVRIARGL